MGVGVACPRCKNNFAFSCNNCSSYQVVIYDDSKLVNYFQTRAVYYIECQRCKSEFDVVICPVCSKKILPQFPFVMGDKGGGEVKKSCFIATACLGENSHTVRQLYVFRDELLDTNYFGKLFIKYYYMYSPKLATCISNRKFLKIFSKYLIVYPAYYISFAVMKILSVYKQN
jgi:hypothetical protein